jgi:hypothetical protein
MSLLVGFRCWVAGGQLRARPEQPPARIGVGAGCVGPVALIGDGDESRWRKRRLSPPVMVLQMTKRFRYWSSPLIRSTAIYSPSVPGLIRTTGMTQTFFFSVGHG